MFILCMALVLIIATFYESYYGTAAAQYSFYKTRWFGFLLFLIAVCVASAALKKYPWKRHQVGFLITHLGILILIFGSFVTFQWGVDGSFPILNGEERNQILLNEKIINIEIPSKRISWSEWLDVGPYLREKELLSFSPSEEVVIKLDRYLPFSKKEENMVESNIEGDPAVQVRISNNVVNIEQWMLMNQEGFEEMSVGPAELVFKRLKDENDIAFFLNQEILRKKFLGELRLTTQEGSWMLPLFSDRLTEIQPVGQSPYQVKKIEYFSDAIVEGARLKNRSQKVNNPAISLMLVGPKGEEKHVAFIHFPDFPSTNQKTSLYGADINFVKRNQLQIGVFPQTRHLYYRVSSSQGIQSGKIHLRKKYETGWMNLKFSIEKFYPQAKKFIKCVAAQVKDPNNPKVGPSVRFRFFQKEKGIDSKVMGEEWLEFYETKEVHYQNEMYRLAFYPKIKPLGFQMYLNQFEIAKNPGTDEPASYQSHVTLKDMSSTKDFMRTHMISMNEPLTYKAYTFYQASYQTDDEGKPIGTILSVSYDPGRTMKYVGSLFIVFGIFMMFFYRKVYVKIFREYKYKQELIQVKQES